MNRKRLLQFVNASALFAVVLSCATVSGSDAPIFEKDVLPIFTKYCFNCHGKSSPQLGLDLRSARLVKRGSQNGPVVVKGSPEESLLWKKVSTRKMPPALFKLELNDAEIETIRKWIESGAESVERTELPADVQEQFNRFEKDVRPILAARCVTCHGAEDAEAGLDLRSLESLVRGSNSGPVIVEGFSDKSVLIRNVTSRKMPPPDSGKPLTTAEIRMMTRWIDKGRFADFVDVVPRAVQETSSAEVTEITAEDREFWSFKKPVAVPLPVVKAKGRVRTPIDRFVLARLESAGLTFSADASKHTLLRRAYFDLTGLPPSLDQVETFLKDARPDAWERLIDRLLASPHYGERWGRHWLDVVGYVDTSGKDFDPRNVTLSDGYWRFRDYVVEATNKDKPWDRFLVEQIAGDELVDWRSVKTYTPEILEALTATGFLRNVLDATNEDISDLPFDRYEALFKLMERVSTSTLGMTLACARCHSHKFDPIPQTDYYRFLSLFTAAYNPSDWIPPKRRHLFSASQVEQDEIARQNGRVKELTQKLTKIRKPYRDTLFDEKLQQLPEAIRADAKSAVETPANKRSDAQKKIAEQHEKALTVTDAEISAALNEADRKACDELRSQIQISRKYLAGNPLQKIQALWDVGDAPTIRLLHRGDVDFAGPKVSPGFLSVLSSPEKSEAVPSANVTGKSTGLRLAFAEWLTDREHPVTARVIVNRLWQHHFGNGIVDTPGNFGATGSQPTHPELLDWLAVEFMRQGWSAKKLHRLMMTSTVYRQSSSREGERGSTSVELSSDPSDVDPDNRLLWRMNLQRLDAETLRDTVLAAGGQTNEVMGGPPVMIKATDSGLQTVNKDAAQGSMRRSVYLLARRSNPLTFLRVFDYPVIDVNCTRRSVSATPLQSLTMINSEFLTSGAQFVARRVEGIVGVDARSVAKIDAAYRLTLSRSPSEAESQAAAAHLLSLEKLYAESGVAQADAAKRAFENVVHMLQCSNEFLYVD